MRVRQQISTDTDATMDVTQPEASSTPRQDETVTPVPEDLQGATEAPGRSSRSHLCAPCGKDFGTEAALNMHKSQKHGLKNVLTPCSRCDRKFQSLASMQQHFDSVHVEKFYCKTDECEYYTFSQEGLDLHRRSYHRDHFPFRCSRCPFVSISAIQLGQHSADSHGTAYFAPKDSDVHICLVCKATITTWGGFLNHMASHPQNKYHCDECEWRFSSARVFNKHCQSSHDTRHHACDFCAEDFMSNDALYSHVLRQHHFECYICHVYFTNEDELVEHLTTNHKEKPTS